MSKYIVETRVNFFSSSSSELVVIPGRLKIFIAEEKNLKKFCVSFKNVVKKYRIETEVKIFPVLMQAPSFYEEDFQFSLPGKNVTFSYTFYCYTRVGFHYSILLSKLFLYTCPVFCFWNIHPVLKYLHIESHLK